MRSLDTNILLRFVLDDHAKLSAHARRIVAGERCRVSVLALAETGFVLLSFYRASRVELVTAARRLLNVPTLEFEHEERLAAVMDAVEAGMDWFDALLWAACPPQQSLLTFDRDFARRAAQQLGRPKVELALPLRA